MKIHLILSPFSNAGPIIEGVYFTPAFPFSLMHWSLLICYHDSLLQCDFFFFFFLLKFHLVFSSQYLVLCDFYANLGVK